jgi:dihydrofolate reductase
MKIAIIVAVAEKNVIGGENKLLWHLPADLKHFKELTTGHCIIMGRKTYESIGRPLPNRTNIVISRNADLKIEGCLVFSSLEEAIEAAEKIETKDKIWIIGGGEIYKQAMNLADELYMTEVLIKVKGDTVFPKVDNKYWEIESRYNHVPDEKNNHFYSFIRYEKK